MKNEARRQGEQSHDVVQKWVEEEMTAEGYRDERQLIEVQAYEIPIKST